MLGKCELCIEVTFGNKKGKQHHVGILLGYTKLGSIELITIMWWTFSVRVWFLNGPFSPLTLPFTFFNVPDSTVGTDNTLMLMSVN